MDDGERFGELAALIVAYVSWRSTSQLSYSVTLHVLVCRRKQGRLRSQTGTLPGLCSSVLPPEDQGRDEGAARTLRIFERTTASADCLCNLNSSLILTQQRAGEGCLSAEKAALEPLGMPVGLETGTPVIPETTFAISSSMFLSGCSRHSVRLIPLCYQGISPGHADRLPAQTPVLAASDFWYERGRSGNLCG